MNWNYSTRRRIALIVSIVIGLIFVITGSFIESHDKTIGTAIILAGVALSGIFVFRFFTRNDQNG